MLVLKHTSNLSRLMEAHAARHRKCYMPIGKRLIGSFCRMWSWVRLGNTRSMCVRGRDALFPVNSTVQLVTFTSGGRAAKGVPAVELVLTIPE